jgi:hypothetical protein
MGRNVKPRLSYEDDARYLLRLCTAVELDEIASAEWKREVIGALNLIRAKFLNG